MHPPMPLFLVHQSITQDSFTNANAAVFQNLLPKVSFLEQRRPSWASPQAEHEVRLGIK